MPQVGGWGREGRVVLPVMDAQVQAQGASRLLSGESPFQVHGMGPFTVPSPGEGVREPCGVSFPGTLIPFMEPLP